MKHNRISRVLLAILIISSSAPLLADGETLGLGILGAAVGGAAGGRTGAAVGAGVGFATGAAIEGSRSRGYYYDDNGYVVYTDGGYDGDYVVEEKTTVVKPRTRRQRARKVIRKRYNQPKAVLKPKIENVEVISQDQPEEIEIIEAQE